MEAKRRNKIKVASFIKEKTGYVVNPNAMFDVQVGFLPSRTSFLSSPVLVNICINGGNNNAGFFYVWSVYFYLFKE